MEKNVSVYIDSDDLDELLTSFGTNFSFGAEGANAIGSHQGYFIPYMFVPITSGRRNGSYELISVSELPKDIKQSIIKHLNEKQ